MRRKNAAGFWKGEKTMKSLDETLKVSTRDDIFAKVTMAVMPVLTVVGSTVTTFCGTSLAELDTSGLVNKICTTYQKWALPFILIAAVLWAITKDEKKKEVMKKTVIGLVIVYIITFCGDIITGTMDDVATTLNSGVAPTQ